MVFLNSISNYFIVFISVVHIPTGKSDAFYPNVGLRYPQNAWTPFQNSWRGPPNNPVQWHSPYSTQMVWKSPWISMEQMKALNMERNRGISQAFGAPTDTLEGYVRHFYPELFRPKPSFPNNYGDVIDLTHVNAHQMQNHPERNLINVEAKCERQYCYMSCRMRLLGGGRCTPGGCMCYFNHLTYNGAPARRLYPDDNIWYELSSEEQGMIMDVLREGRPINLPPTGPPSSNGGPKTDRPPFGQVFDPQPPGNWWGNGNNAPQTKPSYRTTTPGSIGGGWGWNPEETVLPPTARPPLESGGNWWKPEKPMNPNMVTAQSSGGGSIFSDEEELGSNGSGDDDNDSDFSPFGSDEDFW